MIKERQLRTINLTIDTIIELMRDFLPEGDIPTDIRVHKLFLKPGDKKIGILCESPDWEQSKSGKLVEIPVKFELRRLHTVG